MPVSKDELIARLHRNAEYDLASLGPVTIDYNKAHALEYGLSTGFVLGLVASLWRTGAIALLVTFLLVSYGVPVVLAARGLTRLISAPGPCGPRFTIAVLTIQHKPHYFWTTCIPSFLMTWGLATLP